jgi:hypothetical protein
MSPYGPSCSTSESNLQLGYYQHLDHRPLDLSQYKPVHRSLWLTPRESTVEPLVPGFLYLSPTVFTANYPQHGTPD